MTFTKIDQSLIANTQPAIIGVNNSLVSNSTATFIDTGLSATITLSNPASRVKISVVHGAANNNNGTANEVAMGMRIVRDVTVIKTYGNVAGIKADVAPTLANSTTWRVPLLYVDTPGSVGPFTYKTQFNNINAAGSVNIYDSTGGEGIMILEEIK